MLDAAPDNVSKFERDSGLPPNLMEEEEDLLSRLKACRANQAGNSTRPKWLEEAPEILWMPGFFVSRQLSKLSPFRASESKSPTLADWREQGDTPAFIVSVFLGMVLSYWLAKLIFIVLV